MGRGEHMWVAGVGAYKGAGPRVEVAAATNEQVYFVCKPLLYSAAPEHLWGGVRGSPSVNLVEGNLRYRRSDVRTLGRARAVIELAIPVGPFRREIGDCLAFPSFVSILVHNCNPRRCVRLSAFVLRPLGSLGYGSLERQEHARLPKRVPGTSSLLTNHDWSSATSTAQASAGGLQTVLGIPYADS